MTFGVTVVALTSKSPSRQIFEFLTVPLFQFLTEAVAGSDIRALRLPLMMLVQNVQKKNHMTEMRNEEKRIRDKERRGARVNMLE